MIMYILNIWKIVKKVYYLPSMKNQRANEDENLVDFVSLCKLSCSLKLT